MSPEEAMRQYINKLSGLKLGWDPTKKYNNAACFGLRPSTMAGTMAEADSSEVMF